MSRAGSNTCGEGIEIYIHYLPRISSPYPTGKHLMTLITDQVNLRHCPRDFDLQMKVGPISIAWLVNGSPGCILAGKLRQGTRTMAHQTDSHHKRNHTIVEHFADLLLTRFPRLEKDIEAINQTFQAIAPHLVLILEWLEKQPEIDRESLTKLAKIGWFPDLGMHLDNLLQVVQAANEDPSQAETIAIDFLRARVDAIESELAQSYPKRSHLFRDAFEAHREGKYNLSIPVLLAQSDGIFWDATSESLFIGHKRRSDACEFIRKEILEGPLDELLVPLSISAPIWMNRGERSESFEGLNRHQVLHGESIDYGTETNSLKAISTLSYLRCILTDSDVNEIRN